VKSDVNWLISDRIMAMILWPYFWPTLYIRIFCEFDENKFTFYMLFVSGTVNRANACRVVYFISRFHEPDTCRLA